MIDEQYRAAFGVELPPMLDGLDTANLGPGGLRTQTICAYVAWCDLGRAHWRLLVTRGAACNDTTRAGDAARAAQRDYQGLRRAWDALAGPTPPQDVPAKPRRTLAPRRYDMFAELDELLAVV